MQSVAENHEFLDPFLGSLVKEGKHVQDVQFLFSFNTEAKACAALVPML